MVGMIVNVFILFLVNLEHLGIHHQTLSELPTIGSNRWEDHGIL